MVVRVVVRDDVALVEIDNPPVNALNLELRSSLLKAVATVENNANVKGAVLHCKGRTFIAGADLKEFDQAPVAPHLPDVVNAIEQANKPWVAAMHGRVLGGGLEVALGCNYRVAVEGTLFGTPEVNLGVIPGAGGTVRLPRLVGVEQAVTMVTTGKVIDANDALNVGLIDKLAHSDVNEVPAQTVLEAACKFLSSILTQHESVAKPLTHAKIENIHDQQWWDATDAQVLKQARGAAAPIRALASIKHAVNSTFDSALVYERKTFLELRASVECAALRHVFFAERISTKLPKSDDGKLAEIKSAAVIGGGTMGVGIVAALRTSDLPVILIERDKASLDAGMAKLKTLFDRGVARGKFTAEHAQKLLDGIQGSEKYDSLHDTDLVIEAVFEDLSIKRAVFTRLSQVCRDDAILVTNTSYLDPRLIEQSVNGAERFIGLHFFSPANIMKLLEVIPTENTEPAVINRSLVLAKRLGKIPVITGICEGFIGNRILMRYRTAAEQLVKSGVGIAEIDSAMRAFGMAMGPFEAQDLGGLDIAWLQRENVRAVGGSVPECLADMVVNAGRKGQKTSGGWYDYVAGSHKPMSSPAVDKLLAGKVCSPRKLAPSIISGRLVAEMAEEGADILKEGIAQALADIDLVEIHGYGFPRWRGGPMFLCCNQSVDAVSAYLERAPSVTLTTLMNAEKG